jgi:hypothetical protein
MSRTISASTRIDHQAGYLHRLANTLDRAAKAQGIGKLRSLERLKLSEDQVFETASKATSKKIATYEESVDALSQSTQGCGKVAFAPCFRIVAAKWRAVVR